MAAAALQGDIHIKVPRRAGRVLLHAAKLDEPLKKCKQESTYSRGRNKYARNLVKVDMDGRLGDEEQTPLERIQETLVGLHRALDGVALVVAAEGAGRGDLQLTLELKRE